MQREDTREKIVVKGIDKALWISEVIWGNTSKKGQEEMGSVKIRWGSGVIYGKRSAMFVSKLVVGQQTTRQTSSRNHFENFRQKPTFKVKKSHLHIIMLSKLSVKVLNFLLKEKDWG